MRRRRRDAAIGSRYSNSFDAALVVCGVDQAFQLTHIPLDLVQQAVHLRLIRLGSLAERVTHGTVEPECAAFATSESRLELVMQTPVVSDDRLDVVEFVGRNDETDGIRGACQPFDEALFARPPGRFVDLVGVGAAIDDPGHVVAETSPNLSQYRRSALILDRIVQ